MNNPISDFENHRIKVQKNVLETLEHYYGQNETWEESLSNPLAYACVYEGAAQLWLESVLLYDISISEFADQYLDPDPALYYDPSKTHSGWDNGILRQYSIECAAVSLVRNNTPARDIWLQHALYYHEALISAHGYKSDREAIADIDATGSVDTFMPQMVVKSCLNLDYQSTIKLIDLDLVEKDYIWLHVLTLLQALKLGDPSTVNNVWDTLLINWRRCFIEENFNLFSAAHLVLIYNLICQLRGHDFSLHLLSRELLGSNNN